MASVFKPKGSKRYVIYYYQDGKRRKKATRTTDKRVAEQIAAKIEADVLRRKEGLLDPKAEAYRDHEAHPLTEHFAAWRATLSARGNTAKHGDLYHERASRLADLAGAKRLSDLTSDRVQGALAALRSEGHSLGTLNHYRGAIRSFSRWAWKAGRLRDDPLRDVSGFNAQEDRRHDRRTIDVDDLRRLIDAAHNGPPWRRMTGPARALCYRVAVATGLRFSELATLTAETFDLGEVPTVTVAAAYTKNGQVATLPLPRDLAQDLAPFLAALEHGAPTFPLAPGKGALMLRKDLEAAGIAYRDEDGKVFDFHSLRCQLATLADAAGVTPRVVQRLMRHSTLELTGRYTRPRMHDIEGATALLPSLAPSVAVPVALQSTGTAGASRAIESAIDVPGMTHNPFASKGLAENWSRIHNPQVSGSIPDAATCRKSCRILDLGYPPSDGGAA
jgi:integrase